MGKSANIPRTAIGCRLALNLDSSAVTLFVRSDQYVWQPLGEAILGADDFSDQVDALRVEALVRGGEQGAVLLWLPPEQVITRSLQLAPGSEDAARAEATQQIAKDTEFEPAELTVAMAEAEDPKETLVMGALLQTVHEAKDYGRRWGFPKTLVSTRVEHDRFGPNGPVFTPPATIARQAGHAVRRLAVAATVLFALGGAIYGGYSALQPLLQEPTEIRSSGPALASFAVVLDPISPEAAPIDQVRVGGAGSLAIQRLLVPEAERLNIYGTPRHVGPFRPETPAALVVPGEGAPMQVGGAPVHPAYERPGRLSSVLALAAPPDATSVRLAIQRISSAGPPREDVTSDNDGPSINHAGQADPQQEDRLAALAPVEENAPAAPDTSLDKDLPTVSEPAEASPANQSDNKPTAEDPAEETAEPESSPQAPTQMEEQPRPKPEDFESIVAAVIAADRKEEPEARDDSPVEVVNKQNQSEDSATQTASLVPDASAEPDQTETKAEPEADLNAATVFAALQAPAPSKRPRVFERLAKQPVSTRPAIPAVTVPRTVRSAARKVGLSLDETSLIGVIDARSGRRALVRMPTGDYRKVAKGDDLDGWRVSSISREAMRLTRRGQNRTLLLVSR